MSTIYTRLIRMDEGWSDTLEKVILPEPGEVFTAWTWDEDKLNSISDALHLLVQSHEHHEEWAAADEARALAFEFDAFRNGEDDGQCLGCEDDDCPECILANVTREG
jgi:hypothetical protein